MPINGKIVIAPYSTSSSLKKYNGFYYNHITWYRILQFLGVGKHYSPDWGVGGIYIQPKKKQKLSMCGWGTFYRLIRMTKTSLYFKPII